MASSINADNGVSSGSAGLKSSADSSGVLALQTNGTTAFTVGTDQSILMTGAPSIGGAGYGMGMGFRNRIINGAMVIDQRNAGASVTPTGAATYTVDRWVYKSGGVSSKASVQQNAGAITPPVGYINYVGATSLSAYTLSTSDHFSISQYIEGLNTADLGWGTANALTVTLSFWVRSSLTGLNGGALKNNAGDRSYPFSFTVNSANTWEQKTITIAGDTTGTWLTTNGIGIEVTFNLGAYSNKLTTSGAWAAGDYYGPTGANSIVSTNTATFYITGVQLEKGSTATAFDYRPYGTELALCQRYFWKLVGAGTANQYASLGAGVCTSTTTGRAVLQYPVQMRTAPTFSYSGNIYFEDGGGGHAVSAIATSFPNLQSAFVDLTTTGLTLGRGVSTFTGNLTTDYFQASSEL